MRADGMRKVDDLATTAILAPGLYKMLISKVLAKRGDCIAPVIRQQLGALALVQQGGGGPAYGIASPPGVPRVAAR